MFLPIFVFTKHKSAAAAAISKGAFRKLVGCRQDRLVNTGSSAIVVFIDGRQTRDSSKTPTRHGVP
jgi:hypothetical protein